MPAPTQPAIISTLAQLRGYSSLLVDGSMPELTQLACLIEAMTAAGGSPSGNTLFPWIDVANPTTRPDGSALVIGDRISVPLSVAQPGIFEWNGTYWLSEKRWLGFNNPSAISGTGAVPAAIPSTYGTVEIEPVSGLAVNTIGTFIWDVHLMIRLDTTTNTDVSNFWSLQVNRVLPNGAAAAIGSPFVFNSNLGNLVYVGYRNPVNTAVATNGAVITSCTCTRTGTPNNISTLTFGFTYSNIRI